MAQNDPLLAAMQDVTSVAAELREVKNRAEQYGQATSRLQEVITGLGTLAGAVSSIQNQFAGLLSKADAVATHLDDARLASDSLAKSVPDIVARIEAADVSKSVGEFTLALSSVNDRIANQLSVIEHMQAQLLKEREEQRKMFDEITARSERVAGAIERVATDVVTLKSISETQVDQSTRTLSQLSDINMFMSGYAESLATTRNVTEASATNTAAFATKSLQGVAELSKKIDTLQASLESQNKLLSEIKGKKGFLF